jgi:gluconate 2-dehydrogenase gamma chain
MNRRDWLISTLSMATLPEILAAQEHAHQAVQSAEPPAFGYLDKKAAADIEALAGEIIPSGDTPGAREAGVIYFIDRALSTFDQGRQGLYRSGLEQADAQRKSLFPGSQTIAGLTSAQRVELLRAMERTDFFQLLRDHTICGFLCDPSYGGNRGGVGWQAIGFDNQHVHHPPFGYYDAQEKEGTR